MGYGDSEPQPNVKGAEERGDNKKTDTRPTWDQLYLADRISEFAPKGRLTVAALQRLNTRFGVQQVTDALRCLRGFPPEVAVRSPYAYVAELCKEV